MLEFLLVRHGQTDWNVAERIMGRQPIPLNRMGRRQARSLAEYLRKIQIQAIYSSPVMRARQTAEFLQRGRKGCALIEDDGFSEIDYGDWVNRYFPDVHAEYQDLWRLYRESPREVAFPGGESMCEAFSRVAGAVDRVRAEHREGRVAIVSHADSIKFALLHLLALPLDQMRHFSIQNCALVVIRDHPKIGPKLIHYHPTNGFGRD